jgi:hypothetical protein
LKKDEVELLRIFKIDSMTSKTPPNNSLLIYGKPTSFMYFTVSLLASVRVFFLVLAVATLFLSQAQTSSIGLKKQCFVGSLRERKGVGSVFSRSWLYFAVQQLLVCSSKTYKTKLQTQYLP